MPAVQDVNTVALSVSDPVLVEVGHGATAECLGGSLHDAGEVVGVYALDPPVGIGRNLAQPETQDVPHTAEVLYATGGQIMVVEEPRESFGR